MKYAVVPVTPFQQNCTILWCPHTLAAAIIDPGGEPERIVAELRALGAKPCLILLTHAHLDHVGAAPALARQLRVPIHGPHQADAFLLAALPEQARQFGFPPTAAFTPDAWLEEGARATFGEQTLEVLHAPGHSSGHLVYFHRASAFAQVGDVLFRGGIGRGDLPGGDTATLLNTIRKRLFPLGDAVRFIPGHGPSSTFGAERRDNPFVSQQAMY